MVRMIESSWPTKANHESATSQMMQTMRVTGDPLESAPQEALTFMRWAAPAGFSLVGLLWTGRELTGSYQAEDGSLFDASLVVTNERAARWITDCWEEWHKDQS